MSSDGEEPEPAPAPVSPQRRVTRNLSPRSRRRIERARDSTGAGVPKGSHRMPDGSIMKDSDMTDQAGDGIGSWIEKEAGSAWHAVKNEYDTSLHSAT